MTSKAQFLHPQISARREPNNNESENSTTAFYIKLLRHILKVMQK
jgi:hypothetical protein